MSNILIFLDMLLKYVHFYSRVVFQIEDINKQKVKNLEQIF